MSLPPIVYTDEANESWENLMEFLGDRAYVVEITLKEEGEAFEAQLGAFGNFGNGRSRLSAVERDTDGMPVLVVQRYPGPTDETNVERLDPDDIEKMEVC